MNMKGMTVMKFKKLISMAVTAAMVFALAAPAFAVVPSGGSSSGDSGSSGSNGSSGSGAVTETPAANNNSEEPAENSVSVDSSIEIPTVKVTVPTSGAVVLNPYKMKFKVGSDEKTDIFYSAPIICKNESDCDLDVSASASVLAGGDIKIVDAANSVQTTEAGDKNVWIEMKSGKFADKDSTAFSQESTDLKFTFEKAGTGYGYGAKGAGISIEDKYLSLPYSEDATYFGFILNGDVNKKTKDVWAVEDTITVTIVLTFIPQSIAANA